ncbi:MAG: thymidine kinase [Myxococcales bacterium]|nr:thymidine kinase [Myxococcales bacterium]
MTVHAAAFPQGRIEVICGPMFSGKSEELIRRVRRAIIARQRVQVIKPAIDTRYSESQVVSHSDVRLNAVCVASVRELYSAVHPRTEVVGIDEAQFFDDELVTVCDNLANRGMRVIVAGLDMDYRGHPFVPMPMLLGVAEIVTKIQAVCMVCGAPASFSQRLSGGGDTVELGSSEHYEARCRRHFEPEEERQLELLRARAEVLRVPPVS